VGDFLIRDYSERRPEAGSGNQRLFHYQLEPAHAGKHLIRSVSIEFVDRRANSERRGEPVLIETNPLEVNVTSELGKMHPVWRISNRCCHRGRCRRLSSSAGPWRRAWRACSQSWWSWRCAGENAGRSSRARQSPEEVAHAALALLLAENLPGRGLVKEFYLRLTGIVRQYVEDTTGIRAPEQTTEEFLRDMRTRAVFPPERSARLADFLEAADLVKYAGQTAGARFKLVWQSHGRGSS